MENTNSGGTHLCAHEGCDCNVANEKEPVQTAAGIFCSKGCSEGKGCNHSGCNCDSH